jgi:hypothetical protein
MHHHRGRTSVWTLEEDRQHMKKENLETTLDQLETEVLETLENPYSTYLVQFPYTCSFTIPDDGNVTRVTIESRSEVLRYGRNNHDMELQMQLDQEHGKPTYAKHLIEWTRDRMHTIDPKEVTVTYGENRTIQPMNSEDIQQFTVSCLENE